MSTPFYVVVDPTNKPYSYKVNGALTGFEVDLWIAIAAVMVKTFIFREMEYPACLNDLRTGDSSVLLASMPRTDSNLLTYAMSTSYLTDGVLLMTRPDMPGTTLANFKLGNVAVQTGSVGYTYGLDNGCTHLIQVADTASVLAKITTAHADAGLHTAAAALAKIKESSLSASIKLLPTTPLAKASNIAMMFKKTNTALATSVNAALATLVSNGQFKIIHDKYFGPTTII
eukprot:gene11237-13113_t